MAPTWEDYWTLHKALILQWVKEWTNDTLLSQIKSMPDQREELEGLLNQAWLVAPNIPQVHSPGFNELCNLLDEGWHDAMEDDISTCIKCVNCGYSISGWLEEVPKPYSVSCVNYGECKTIPVNDPRGLMLIRNHFQRMVNAAKATLDEYGWYLLLINHQLNIHPITPALCPHLEGTTKCNLMFNGVCPKCSNGDCHLDYPKVDLPIIGLPKTEKGNNENSQA